MHRRGNLSKKNNKPSKDKEFKKCIDKVSDYTNEDTSSDRIESRSKVSNLKASITHLDSY